MKQTNNKKKSENEDQEVENIVSVQKLNFNLLMIIMELFSFSSRFCYFSSLFFVVVMCMMLNVEC